MIFYAVLYYINPSIVISPVLKNTNLNALVSAGHLWTGKHFLFPRFDFLRINRLFLDSGGFQFVNKFREYPFSVDDYVSYINTLKPDYVAVMDYPCNYDILKKYHIEAKTQIRRTIEKTCQLYEKEVDSILVPVLQGDSIEDFIFCVDELKKYGLVSNYMAIGSIRDKPISEVRKLLLKLRKLLPHVQFHAFGLGIKFLKDSTIRQEIYSTDSIAWLYVQRFGKTRIFTGSRFVELNSNKQLSSAELASVSLRAYIEYVDFLNQSHQNQTKLMTEEKK